MSNVRLFVGGSPVQDTFLHHSGKPQYFGPPFAGPRYPDTPVANAPYDAAAPRADFVASEPLNPALFERQMNAFLDARPGVNDIIELVLVPTNHFLFGVRFDVVNPDPLMNGATVSITGVRYRVKAATAVPPSDSDLDATEDPEFALAATDQGLSPIPLDVPSSNVLWLAKCDGDYVIPRYVEPEIRTTTGGDPVTTIHESGALVLGLKIKSVPTAVPPGNPAPPPLKIWEMRGPCFMSAVISGFNFKTNT
jgi:hypothetical protein